MVFDLITEKYKQHRLEVGIKIGREEGREERQRAWEGWNERREAAFRAGIPFDEPPPGYAPQSPANGAEGG